MCGRYSITKKKNEIENILDVEFEQDFTENYNIPPASYMPIIYNKNSLKVNMFRWGLIPYWARDTSISNNLINARIETIFEKPSFKKAIRRQRCCIIADGYYEWKKMGKYKQPYYIHFKDSRLFMFGGIWESWNNRGNIINSFSIITRKANKNLDEIHHRMPVIMDSKLKDMWLSNIDKYKINEITYNNLNDDLTFYAVSQSVNSTQNNYRELINSI